MLITPHLIDQIVAGLKAKGIKRGKLAEAVGLGPSWVTNLLKGDLQTLRDEHRFTIERLLGIDLEEGTGDVVDRRFSPDAYRVADMVEKSSEAAALGRLMLKIFRNPQSISSCIFQVLTREETEAVGRDVLAGVTKNPEAAAVGREVLQIIENSLAAILEDPRPKNLVRKSLWLEHRGGVSAGIYPKPLCSRWWKMDSSTSYESDDYLLRVFGDEFGSKIPDGSDILVRPYRGDLDGLGEIFVIRSGHGRRLAQHFVYHGNTEEDPENDGRIDMFRSHGAEQGSPSGELIPDEKMKDLYDIEAKLVQVIE